MALHLEAQVAVAKINKYASAESGDTVELIERPHGGLSIVMADGQRSGYSAKAISNIVVRKAISLISEGVRDGAVARATHDYLLLQRGGKVSAELHIISIDLVTHTLVISRNARCPLLLRRKDTFEWFDAPADAVGIHRNTKPAITELQMEAEMTLVAFTDGVWGAGSRIGSTIDLPGLLAQIDPASTANAQMLADSILSRAMELDQNRPKDDATVVVVHLPAARADDTVRRLFMRFPV